MFSLRLLFAKREKDEAIVSLYDQGTLGIAERDLPGGQVELEAFFETAVDPRCKLVEPFQDWRQSWQPIEVGERFFLVPDWRTDEPPPGRMKLIIHAAQASGSGYHAPTQLAIVALEQTLRPADVLLDLGTGSGILAEAARLLGATQLYACDIDPVALHETIRNETPARLFLGSVRALASQSVDVIAANLNAHSLVSLRKDLLRVLKPKGRLILSGFKQRHLDMLLAAFPLPHRALEQEDWRCLIVNKG